METFFLFVMSLIIVGMLLSTVAFIRSGFIYRYGFRRVEEKYEFKWSIIEYVKENLLFDGPKFEHYMTFYRKMSELLRQEFEHQLRGYKWEPFNMMKWTYEDYYPVRLRLEDFIEEAEATYEEPSE